MLHGIAPVGLAALHDAVRQCRMRLAKLGSKMLSVCGYLVSTSNTAEKRVSTSFAAEEVGSCSIQLLSGLGL